MLPVLIGCDNPVSSDPRLALYPRPEGCTGHRIWSMLYTRVLVTNRDYLRGFDRHNVSDLTGLGLGWRMADARQHAPAIIDRFAGRQVLVFGNQVRDLLMPQGHPMVHPCKQGGGVWRWLPHPSGRCRWYNDGGNRLVASLLLEELFEGGKT